MYLVRFVGPIFLYPKSTKQTEEAFSMKTAICKSTYRPMAKIPYPNAATRREVLHKLLDTVLVAASGMGIAAMFLLYMTLG